ncbi:endonuclease exonuclease phosphatase [Micractinium conductrix]|uniref:Endonuclease exonuclease phosphatase n=1 Tax=Micractinium conductrix TaxID=554055 RepID=A0A2P6VQ70_9CHLO|nr:endonuclease exonuclease phosphatase [Micractinium conductrix]|eukprot:PSC76221.1 endonuclease exonuclease phosphatase [Micractinium conductrix]
MQFESAVAERLFLTHFHASQARRDLYFSATRVALAVLAALRLSAAEADARLRVLLLATHVLAGTTVLLASLSARQRYAAARPYLLLAVRVAHDVLWTGLLWHSTAADRVAARSAGDQSWAGLFMLWVTWSKTGYHLLMQLGHPLPFNWEAVLAPCSAVLGLLNHRRLCSLLTEAGPAAQQAFYGGAFTRLASMLAPPTSLLFAWHLVPAGCRWSSNGAGDSGDAPACTWSLCAAGSGGSSSAGAVPAAPPSSSRLAACYCEAVFGIAQLALAVPLVFLACSEARSRRRFAAGEQHRQRLQLQLAGHARGAEGGVPNNVPRVGWSLTHDGLRLLLLLGLIEPNPRAATLARKSTLGA